MKTRRRTADQITNNTTPRELLYSIKQMKNQRNAALAAFIYLTGCRISEIIGKVKVIPIYKGKGEERELVETKTIEIPPLKKSNITLISDDIILVNNVPCLKWRNTVPRRNIPLKLSSPDDIEFIKIFIDYYNTLPDEAPLFKLTRNSAWRIINKELKVFTHYLIHQRCTELVTNRGFTELYLKKLRGWRDTRAAEVYAHLGWVDLAKKL